MITGRHFDLPVIITDLMQYIDDCRQLKAAIDSQLEQEQEEQEDA